VTRAFLGPLFVVAGVLLVPWAIFLAVTLPGRHVQTRYYDVAWAGFDVALATLLVVTGIGILRGRPWVPSAAVASATMLACDAWFDVLTSQEGGERVLAIVLAVCVEVPVAIACLVIARDWEAVTRQRER
jgi:hypothetical protein